MTAIDRWIIGLLVMALSGVLWFLIIDARETTKTLSLVVSADSNRITALESRVDWLERVHLELKNDLRDHRSLTEKR